MLTHLGPSGMSGHFVAFCKSPVDGKWYLYNDAQVSSCADPRARDNLMIEGIPYVLFYQKYENANNQITLYIRYHDKELYIDVEKDINVSELVKRIKTKYEIMMNLQLSSMYNNNLIPLNLGTSLSQYPQIKNNSVIYAQEC